MQRGDRTTVIRRITGWFNQHPRATLRVLLAGPLGWISVVYLGSLFILLMHAFWSKDSFTGKVEPFNWTLDAFAQIVGNPVYVTIAARTIGIALLVTITAALIALPVAYYMARIASPRKRALLLIAVTMPLWASYLVKIYAWRTILQTNGLLGWAISPLGLEAPGLTEIGNSWLVLTYLWLPYMILPVYAGLERIPNSLLEHPPTWVPRVDHLPTRHLPAADPCARGRLHLHLLAEHRRLHRPRPSLGREVHRQRHLRQLSTRQLPGGRCVLVRPDPGHDRLPPLCAPLGRVRVALMQERGAHG